VAKAIHVSDSMSTSERHKHLKRALHELNNAHAVCHHPSIQRFFEVELVYGVPFLLSRKRDATLRDVIAEGPVRSSELISIATQIVHALNYCTKRSLVCHQDLKPENIFVDFIRDHFEMPAAYPLTYKVHLADFELANAYLMLGHPYGSRPYMAPEQYKRTDDREPAPDFSRVDVFALGVIIYEMLTGGIHPVGEHVSLIWPAPAPDKSRKWLREDPWKQWIERGAELLGSHEQYDSGILEIIRACLVTDLSLRPNKPALEALLLNRLNELNADAHQSLVLLLSYFDSLAIEGEEAGWPYYAERLAQLNATFGHDSM
jgi:serine/threonine protein kinase